MSKSLRQRSNRLYRVKVRGGGSFLYDVIDVGRFLRRMDEDSDVRPVTIRRAWHFLGRYW